MKKCEFCKNDYTPKSHFKTSRFCSRKCADVFRIGKKFKLSIQAIEKIKRWHIGFKHSEETKQKIRLKKIGLKQSPEWVEKRVSNFRGEKSSQWKGGYQNKLMHIRKRRVIKLGNGSSHTLKEWENLKAQYNWTCPCCKKSEPEITLSQDHIIPLSKGGSDNIENIQPLCRSCNCKKSAKIIKY